MQERQNESMTDRQVTAETLKDWLTDGQEIALLDVREEEPFGRGHIFLAINVPLSRLELLIGQYVPRKSTRIVFCDDDDGLAERARYVLTAFGYSHVWRLGGGVGAWCDQGYQVFSGTYVLEHAFGHFITSRYRTPVLTAKDLMSKLENGENLIIIDTRPFADFETATIPGSINVPLGELASRFKEVVPDASTEVIVHCAGLTRGALGAQTLINGGIENPVAVLLDGTKGWAVAGGTLEQGANRRAPSPSNASLKMLDQMRRCITKRFPIPIISEDQLESLREDSGDRTLFLIDVRTRDEYEEGHLAGSIWIPGGELVGMTQDHLGTRNANICLVDDGKGRAQIVASWLLQQGWRNATVLEGGISGRPLVTGPAKRASTTPVTRQVPTISPRTLAGRIDSGEVVVIDFARSLEYWGGHIPGAWWMNRSRLPAEVSRLPHAACYVTTGGDDLIGRLAAADLEPLVQAPVMALDGGTAAWGAAGFALETGMSRSLCEMDDVYWDFAECPDDGPEARKAKWLRALEWRSRLKNLYEWDVTVPFVGLCGG